MTVAPDVRKVEHLRALVARWQAELRRMGWRPKLRRGRSRSTFLARLRPWEERERAIRGAAELALCIAIECALQDDGLTAVERRVLELRRDGATLPAIAQECGVSVGTAWTITRRVEKTREATS